MRGWIQKLRTGGETPRAAGARAERIRLLEEVKRLEREASLSTAPARARLWNEIGGLAAEAGEHDEAQRSLGHSIDGYLEAGYYEAAAAMCRRLLRMYPDAVRARSTLALLAIGNRDVGDARQAIADYVCATKRTATQRYGIPRLQLMADVTDDPTLLRCIGTALGELGDASGKEAVLGGAKAPPATEEVDAGERWERLLRAAMISRENLGERAPEAPAGKDTEAA